MGGEGGIRRVSEVLQSGIKQHLGGERLAAVTVLQVYTAQLSLMKAKPIVASSAVHGTILTCEAELSRRKVLPLRF